MTYTPIPAGTPGWDVPVNAALTDQDSRITTAVSRIATVESKLDYNPGDQTLLAWTFDPATNITAQTALTSGQLYMVRLPIRTAATISTVVVPVGTAGSSLTAGQSLVGLYDQTGTLLGQSADQSASWTSTGVKNVSLTSPVSVSAGYYVVAIMSTGTTPPSIFRGSNASIGAAFPNVGLSTENSRFAVHGAGLTALPSSVSMGSRTPTTGAVWVGLM
ncbi:hypothetical protein ACFUJU_07905 [Streptomyces sp. NPDC057235]|uniref:hypothetical protein n=1 Tax=Streptomyces sp. NPDC057235 TaxID=3346058 RepID=UPI00363B2D1B